MYILILLGFFFGLIGYYRFRDVKWVLEIAALILGFMILWMGVQFYTSISFYLNIFDHIFYVLFFGFLTIIIFLIGSKTYFYDKYLYGIFLPIIYLLLCSGVSFEKRQAVGMGIADNSFRIDNKKIRIDWYITGFTDQGTLAIVYGNNLIFEYPEKYYEESLYGIGKYVEDVSISNASDSLYFTFKENHRLEPEYNSVKLRNFFR